MSDVYPASHVPGRAARPRRGRAALYVVAAVLVLAVLGAAFVLVTRHAGGPDQRAIGACEDAVRVDLVAPGTATFSGETATAGAGGTWQVYGTVDSQGDTGTTQRNTFTCVLDSGFRVTDAEVL